jgi:hypothetical protein
MLRCSDIQTFRNVVIIDHHHQSSIINNRYHSSLITHHSSLITHRSSFRPRAATLPVGFGRKTGGLLNVELEGGQGEGAATIMGVMNAMGHARSLSVHVRGDGGDGGDGGEGGDRRGRGRVRKPVFKRDSHSHSYGQRRIPTPDDELKLPPAGMGTGAEADKKVMCVYSLGCTLPVQPIAPCRAASCLPTIDKLRKSYASLIVDDRDCV